MGKNKDGRRSNRKNSKKNTFNKYGKYTNRSLRISEAQINNTPEIKDENIQKIKPKIIFPVYLYIRSR
jgi:hypothetical protein